MRSIQSGILLASAAAVLALGACSQDKGTTSASPASKEPAAATVNGTPISQRTIDMMAKDAAGSGHPDTPESRKAIIDQLALQMVVAEEAVKKGLDKTPEVREQIDAIRQSVLANAYVEDFIKRNPVSDEMLKAEYDRIKAGVTGTEFKARHILVEKEAEAKAIIAQLKRNPAAFEKLAKEKSRDPGSKPNGGELGWFDPKRMVPEFGAALAKLEKGKITEEPVKTQFGYHVILLEDSRPIEPPPLDAVKPQLQKQIQQQSVMKDIDALKAKAKIEIVAASAPAPAAPVPGAPAAPPATPAVAPVPAPAK
ncbi:MAG: peptidylprolyl isomerase [Bryobacteraceae bacterium]